MSLLRPEAVLPKVISGGGRWSVRKPRFGGPAFCLMLEGSCRLDADGLDTVELGAGLTDPVLAPALRRLHADVGHGWTVERLAREAAVSRAVFAQRFTRTIGVPPMQYLLEWRVALAKDLLRRERPSVAQVAQQVGYQSATAFTTAFARVAGCSPTEFARTASHRQDVAFAGGDRAVQ